MRRGRYALILDSLEANYHTGRKPCDLVAIATIPVGRHYGFAARKGDHLLGEVNRSLEMLKSRTAEWRARHRKWWNSECPTADTDANSLMTGEYRDQTDRQKVRQADRQTDRQADRQTGRQTGRQAEGQRDINTQIDIISHPSILSSGVFDLRRLYNIMPARFHL